jgi:hypothetical protein
MKFHTSLNGEAAGGGADIYIPAKTYLSDQAGAG